MRISVTNEGLVTYNDGNLEIKVEVPLDINHTIDFTNANVIGLNNNGQGVTGATGATGSQGPTGATGATGVIGPITDLQFSGNHIVSISNIPTIASGSSQNDATILPNGKYAVVCRSDLNTKGVRLTDTHTILGLNLIIINDDHTNNNFKLYPPNGGKLNDSNIDAHIEVVKGKSVMITCFDATIGSSKWSVVGL